MANSNIDALYVGSLRIKYHISFLSNFTFYKWCVTKVAHCMPLLWNRRFQNLEILHAFARHYSNTKMNFSKGFSNVFK